MSELVNAVDNFTTQQIGENGHVEYGWSNNIQERILQFSFQLVRTNEEGVNNLQRILEEMLAQLKHKLENSKLLEKEIARKHLSILYRLIGHTRDIIDGKGEYLLTYMMIYTWYNYYPKLAFFAIKCMVDLDNEKIHQYGSWKDIKYFCRYCYKKGLPITHPLIVESIRLINEQLEIDYANLISSNLSRLTLVGEWVPREKSSFSWMYQALATDYFKQYIKSAQTEESKKKAIVKCKMEYRQILSALNKAIGTLQIKQCSNKWSEIDFNKVTSISISKQKKALLNITQKGDVRYSDRLDRIECAEKFTNYIKQTISANSEKEMKGKRISMGDFTRQARKLYSSYSSNFDIEKELLNSQWRDNSTQNNALSDMIPMVDISGSMDGEPLDVAIAIGIRIAEKSKLGKRVMTFSKNPKWINLEPYNDFVSQVKQIENSEIGYYTDFYKALKVILDSIISNNLQPKDVEDMILVILSDMQINQAEENSNFNSASRKVLYDSIKTMYAEAGKSVHGIPYNPPRILFWNLRNTTGFPSLSSEKNVSMMSGFSPVLLNVFCDKGMNALNAYTPFSVFEETLNKERYKIMSNYLEQNID